MALSIQRSAIYNLIGAIVPLVVSFFTVPLYLELIGEARYGVLTVVWLLLGYFGLFDLGLGRATAQRIAVLHDASAEERAHTFWTALTLNLGLGILGGLLISSVAVCFLGSVFKIEDALRPELLAAIPWLILAVPMATLSGVFAGALQGRERFLELNLISVSGTVLFQLIPLSVAAFWKVDLRLLLPAALFARYLTLVALFLSCQRHIILNHPPSFMREQARQLIRFGGWVTVTSFIGPMMVILDRFIIAVLSGAKAVSFYTVPFQLGERCTILSSSLVSALFPRFAAVSSAEEYRLAVKGLRLLVVVMTPLVAVVLLFMEPFLAWWINPVFADQSAQAGQIILLGFWFNSFAKIPSVQLQARGRPDLVAKCHLAEILPYFLLLYLGISLFGLVGAAGAFSLRVVLDLLLLAAFAGVLRYLLCLLLIPVLLLAVAFFISLQSSLSQLEWISYVMAHLLFTIVWAWRQSPASLCEITLNSLEPLFNVLRKR
ncbi:MAG: flippase [Candidatus Electrothrix sp. AR4]|nr:flippase [Candidatus Electrothrix sp. AR4]